MPVTIPDILLFTPQGRLTLTSGAPVMTSGVSSSTSIYYTPATGSLIPISDGSKFYPTTFSELTNTTTNNTTNPAACTTNSNYDLFVWDNGGTITLSRGPAWTSDTARGTGAGTTELQRLNGLWTNKVAITNGPAANKGTYVGTVRTDGSSQVNWTPQPSASAGGTEAKLHVFNAYNQVGVPAQVLDSTSSWTYTSTTWRSANNSNTNRISYIDGLSSITADTSMHLAMVATSTNGFMGVVRDSTSATPAAVYTASFNSTGASSGSVRNVFLPSLGYHYLQAMERSDGGGSPTVTFYSTWVTPQGFHFTSLLSSM